MNIPSPAKVAANRTARLLAEAKAPVYSTETKPVVREHMSAVELETDMGGRFWSHMPDSEVDAYVVDMPLGWGLSDIDHSAKCWCFK